MTTINKTDGSILTTVADGTVNTSASDLTLVGKQYLNYGEPVIENFVKLLENFKNTTAPSNPLVGQIWYDSTNKKLKVYRSTGFVEVANIISSNTQPTNSAIGDGWFDTINNIFKIYNGAAWIEIGPKSVAFNSLTGTPTTLAGYGITDAQATLVSATNIKTINGTSLLGSGDITIAGGGSGIALTDLSVGTEGSASGNGAIAYNNSTGVFTYTPPDLSGYLTAETNDLTSAVTWANIPDANVPASAVTQHQGALTITESQVSDLGTYQLVPGNVSYTCTILVGSTDFGDAPSVSLTDNSQPETIIVNNPLANIARVDLPNITTIGKQVIVSPDPANSHSIYVDYVDNRLGDRSTSVSNGQAVIYIWLGSGWNQWIST